MPERGLTLRFERFTSLPAELRLRIWELHFQQRRLIALRCAGGWWHMPHHSLPAEVYAETLDPTTGLPVDAELLLRTRLVCSEANHCFASRHTVAGLAFAQSIDASLSSPQPQSRVAFRLDSTETPSKAVKHQQTFAVNWDVDMIYIGTSMYPTWFLEHCPWRDKVQRIAFLLHDERERRLGANYWLGRQPEHGVTVHRLRSLQAIHHSTFAQLRSLRLAWLVVAMNLSKDEIAGARDEWGFVQPSSDADARFPLCLTGYHDTDDDPYLTRAERVVRMIRGGAEGLGRDMEIQYGFEGN